jgi:hypothetical protein
VVVHFIYNVLFFVLREGNMPAVMVMGSFLVAIGFFIFSLFPMTRPEKDLPSGEILASILLSHQKAAVDWCLRTACPDGPVPAGGLTLPPGYAAAGLVQSVAEGGRVSTYYLGGRIDVLSAAGSLGALSSGGPEAGLSQVDMTIAARDAGWPGRIASSAGAVPSGVPVVSQQVR